MKKLTKNKILQLFEQLTVWKRGGERAPHKPLLVLYALGRCLRNADRLTSFSVIDPDLSAKSAGLGHGSEFILRLPLRRAGSGEIAEPDNAQSQLSASVSGRRILVVDDVASSALLLCELLAARGYDVRSAYDGPTALTIARHFHPDVVLLDIGMPGMDGYETARRLRSEHGKRMHLIALTGYGHADARAQAREAGFEKHLLKGMTLDDMTRELESL